MSGYKILQYDIKDIDAVLLEILSEIDRVCKRNNIKYVLAFGTLLGAVRHKGFIPWDDDLDIWMMRDDYDRFIRACKNDLGSRYFLSCFVTEREYPYDFAKVMKKKTVYLEEWSRYRKIHKGIYVDIFPLDNVKLGTYGIQRRVFSFFRRARWRAIDKKCMPRDEWKKSEVKRITWFTAPLSVLGNVRLHVIMERIMRHYNRNSKCQYVYTMCHPYSSYRLFKKEWFEETIDLEFEGMSFPCPKDYKKILKQAYGNYMKLPPENERLPHDVVEVKI